MLILFCKNTRKFFATDIIKILEYLLTTYLLCLLDVFFNIFGISMGTHCAPFLAYLFPYSYEADFIQGSFTSRAIYMMSFHYIILRIVYLHSNFENIIKC
jgi:hypothetical protein